MNNAALLLIDDDPAVHSIVRALGPELDLTVEIAAEGKRGLELAQSKQYQLVILDLGLPDLSGSAVLKQLRASQPALPILLLTSRSAQVDKVLGLEMGADDYITKPFAIQELVARARSLLRRKSAYQRGVEPEVHESVVKVGELEIDFQCRSVSRAGVVLELSVLEFDILAYLIRNRGRVVPREELLTRVWGYAPNAATNFDATITTNISRLRSKIEPRPEKPQYFLTVRGVGYRFLEAPAADGEQGQ